MKEYAMLKVSDLEKAWEIECSEVRDVLKRLYPDDLPPRPREVEWEDVTDEIVFVRMDTFLIIRHNGTEIARQRGRGTTDGNALTINFFLNGYGVGNYKFKLFDHGNWQLLRVKK